MLYAKLDRLKTQKKAMLHIIKTRRLKMLNWYIYSFTPKECWYCSSHNWNIATPTKFHYLRKAMKCFNYASYQDKRNWYREFQY